MGAVPGNRQTQAGTSVNGLKILLSGNKRTKSLVMVKIQSIDRGVLRSLP